MSNRLIESNMDSSNIYRIRESSFDRNIFINDSKDPKQTYIPGLFDWGDVLAYTLQEGGHSDIQTSSDIWDIANPDSQDCLSKEPPKPLTTLNMGFMPGLISEKPSYLVNYPYSEFYPFGNSLQYVNSNSYMSSESGYVIFKPDTIPSTNKYQRDVAVSFMGASPGSDKNVNILYYDNGKSNWVDNWTSGTAEFCGNDLFISYDITEIKKNVSASFLKNVSVDASVRKTYCFSFFARLSDEIPGDTDNRSNERYIGTISVTLPGSNQVFNLNTFWKRYYATFTIEASGSSASFDLRMAVNNLSLPVKISGMMLEEGVCPTPYDKRWIKYVEEPAKLENDIIYYPISIKSNKLGLSNSWTVVYKRYIEASPDAPISFLDKIGDVTYGYQNGEVVVNGNQVSDLDINVGDFFNHYETIIVTYDMTSHIMKMKVVTSSGKSYEVDNISISSISSTEDDITYNILLGGTTLKNGRYGYYKDMMIDSYYLTEDSLKPLLNECFNVYILDSYTSPRDYFITPDVKGTLSWDSLFNLDYAVKGESAYRLSTDAPSALGYKAGDVVVCTESFNVAEGDERPNMDTFTIYWSRTPMSTEYRTYSNQVVFRSGCIREGYIGE